ncbi:centrosomal protein of 170 kDa protein B [Aplochiton taeniatus]
MSVTSWFLVSSSGTRHRLPREMIFVGREDCELMLQSRSVDKQHAVINYNPSTDEHLVKDLGSLNGTFVNDLRIPDQTYMTLKLSDVIRFGYDSHVYVLERSQHKVPEEALKHEKYTSQLQIGLKAAEDKKVELLDDKSKLDKTDRKAQEVPVSRPTPLYGQPSWWGEEDAGSKGQHAEDYEKGEDHQDIPKESAPIEADGNDSLPEYKDAQSKSIFLPSYQQEPSYFEIPTKEFLLHPKSLGDELHEIPTKDTDAAHASAPPTKPNPPVVQSHASFTIEFDDCLPGKIKIKDHVTKFSSRQRKQPSNGSFGVPTPTDVMSAESKVADWLVHSDVSMMRRRPTCEDVFSTKSDLAVNTKTRERFDVRETSISHKKQLLCLYFHAHRTFSVLLEGYHHDDGTQSDSEDPVTKGKQRKSHHSIPKETSALPEKTIPVSPEQPAASQRVLQPQQYSPPRNSSASPVAPERPLSHSPPQAPAPTANSFKQGPADHLPQQAFIIEFFDDNTRKKRSQSFTHNPAHGDSYSALKAKLERRKGGERPASVHGHIPPTQQVTVPLKGQGHGGPQRSSSLKREKSEGENPSPSSGPSSRSSSSVVIKPFGSVGNKSKLAQEFAAEFLKDCGPSASPSARDRTLSPPMSAPPVMSPSRARIPSPVTPPASSSISYPTSPLQPPAVAHPVPAAPLVAPAPAPAAAPSQVPAYAHSCSPVHSAVPVSPLLPLGVRGVDPKASRTLRNEEEDSLSDAGTYTIETESQDKEVEEARNMIDQVFGVLDSPEYSGGSPGTYRPIINDGKGYQGSHPSNASTMDQMHVLNPTSLSGAPTDPIQSAAAAAPEGPKWVSRWASLADSYAEPGSTPPQTEFVEGDSRFMDRSIANPSHDTSESESSQSCRTRRLLPQVPPVDKSENLPPSILIRHEHFPGPEVLDRSPVSPHPRDSSQRLCVQDDVDPDSLSDNSRSDDGSVLERSRRNQARTSPGDSGRQYRTHDKPSPSTRSTCFYIGSEDIPGKPDHAQSPVMLQPENGRDPFTKSPPTTVLIRHLSSHEPPKVGVKPNNSAPNLYTQEKDLSLSTKDHLGPSSSFVRQESFTKEQPSDDVQVKRLPHIASHPSLKDMEQKREESTVLLLDTRLHSSCSGRSSKKGSSHIDDSLSGESDVDTASTVSQVSNKNMSVSSAPRKHSATSGSQKDKYSSVSQDKGRQLSARERLSEKRRSQPAGDNLSKAEATKRFQMRRSAGNRGSLDLSEGHQGSGKHWAESAASDQEAGVRPSSRSKKLTAPLKEDNGLTPKTAAQQVLIRSNSLSAPRPTRASMLRRARLGETSDNEGAETDRGSQNSDHHGAPARGSADGKKLSRLDILAMPRKRTGSFTAPSDNESTSTGRTGFSNRSAEPPASTRKASVGEAKQGSARGSGASGKQTLSRTRSSGAKYPSTSSSRRKPKGSDYTSTSDEEYEATSGTPKHKRAHSSVPTQTLRSQKSAATRSKSVSQETEEEEVQNEADHYQNWSTHSAEIAKLSQDLAKDLAILAREIHDVAGDGDSASSGMGTTTSPSSIPNTPASTMSTREELVQHIPEASLNYQKVPPGSTVDPNMNDQDASSKPRSPWNREEVILDNLMLNPVSQLSQAIRENTEQLAEKMKVLFHNKTEAWEEIEAKINAENEVPILKTSNKEISSILNELRRVQRQLEVINTIVEPSGNLVAATGGVPEALTRPSARERKTATKPTANKQHGHGPSATTSTSNANESTKRSPRGTQGAHYMA